MSPVDDGPDDEGRLSEHYWQHAHEVRGLDRALRLVHGVGTSEASRADGGVREAVDALGPHLLPLTVRLALSAPDEDSPVFFAAGPLEDWVGRVPEEDLARAAVEARGEPRFREATKHVVLCEQRRRLWEHLTGRPGGTRALG